MTNNTSIAHPSEKGGYNSLLDSDSLIDSIAHPSEKGGYNDITFVS